ncbi:TldD/PmbA family protein [Dyadobacter luteus]|uniref:TldD/PmbA family protein n=1 Tax=Dyadobacter luteus TaxID=2259619 RepID=A0A3D8YER2_9BACT|nr:TldD/PmbA family protein [Dyadobacter luteus]REA63062.1 TldD/PmbA family protein [Dyadobacter luteus]
MAILSEQEAKIVISKALGFSGSDEIFVSLKGENNGNIRYAGNSVSTSGETSNISLSVTSVFGKKSGTATTSELDEEAIRKVVSRAEELARLAPDNPEYVKGLQAQQFQPTPSFFTSTDQIDADYRAQGALHSIESGKKAGLNVAGFIQNASGFTAIGNDKGLFGYNKASSVNFSATVRTEDGSGSGYAAQDYNDSAHLNIKSATDIAVQKALASSKARALEPGKYTVILEPQAGQELLRNLVSSFDARSAEEGRSFLSKKGGGTRLGEKLFDEKVTIYSDPFHRDIPSLPFSPDPGDGRPIEKTVWVEKGVVKNLSYSRYWADKKSVKPIVAAGGFIFEGGTKSLAELIKNTERGILVTRLWYIRAVDPQTLLYTGLTRDGTFYIENGQIKYPVKNFRFNESPVIMLNNLEEAGIPQRVRGSLVPPLKIRDFTFTSLSDAV